MNESSKYYQLHNSDFYDYALPFNACSCLSAAAVVAVILTVLVARLTKVVESVLPTEQTTVQIVLIS